MHCWFNPRRQLRNRVANVLTEVVQLLSVHPPLEHPADVGAGQPELDILLFVNHQILDAGETEARRRIMGGRTLIMVRSALTVPNAALAGAMPEISFARSKASMVTLSKEATPSRLFGRWELASMFEYLKPGVAESKRHCAQLC